MKKLIPLIFLLVACTPKPPVPEETVQTFSVPFGKKSTVEATINPKAPATLKEYKLAVSLAIEKK